MMLIQMEDYSHTQLLESNYRTIATVPIGHDAPDYAWVNGYISKKWSSVKIPIYEVVL